MLSVVRLCDSCCCCASLRSHAIVVVVVVVAAVTLFFLILHRPAPRDIIALDTSFNTASGWNGYVPFSHHDAAVRARGELSEWEFYGSSVDEGRSATYSATPSTAAVAFAVLPLLEYCSCCRR